MAVLDLQNWGRNAPKPLWTLRLPTPIIPPRQFMKLPNVEISSPISYRASKFLILKRFDQHNEVVSFKRDHFCCIIANWGCKTKNWGAIARTYVEPLLNTRSVI